MFFTKLIENYDNQRREKNIFHDLMTKRVHEILLVASLYDSFIVESDGILSEQIYGEYYHLNLSQAPRVTSAYTSESALELFNEKHFDLVILMAGLDLDTPIKLSATLKEMHPETPIILLLNNNSSLPLLEQSCLDISPIDKTFVWNGYSKLFVGIIKYIEDQYNIEHDTGTGMVRVILLIEDSIRYYSRYLPILYSVIMKQTQVLIEDENLVETNKILRMRARPKILLATSYEEAVLLFNKYEPYILTVISDVRFTKDCVINARAGFEFLNMAKERIKDLPVMIQSSELENKEEAHALGAYFADKNSNSLDLELKTFIQENLGFGSFIFRSPDGKVIASARNMAEFTHLLKEIPAESLLFHAVRNHFSAWLLARGEIQFARMLKKYRISDFKDLEAIRDFVIRLIEEMRKFNARGSVISFDEHSLYDMNAIMRLANGSLGGKGRGLTFISSLLENFSIGNQLLDLEVKLPVTVVIGIDAFDQFVERNNLWHFAYSEANQDEVNRAFIACPLSDDLDSKIKRFLSKSTKPLAVRSSGLFEDMLMLPFSGIYSTYILPNSSDNFNVRVRQVEDAIRLIYASMFSKRSRSYFEAASYKLEEERMAIVIQELVGTKHGNYYYPDISGTAQSYNYYPVSYLKPEDGLCVSALGLGAYVVDGGEAFRFCPAYPKLEILSFENQLKSGQKEFYVIDLTRSDFDLLKGEEACYALLPIEEALSHGTLSYTASTLDYENNRLVPGTSAKGPLVINFANILKYDALPFAKAISLILDLGTLAMGTPIEIEYALDLNTENHKPVLYLLQLKPLIRSVSQLDVDLDAVLKEDIVLYSEKSMGNGLDTTITDIVYVDPDTFDRSKTEEIALEIEEVNEKLKLLGRRYVLIGPGRWGTRDRWLGVPVSFGQISNARVIVETALKDFQVDSSLGSHFFHNVTSMNIGYFTVPYKRDDSFIDYDYLKSMQCVSKGKSVIHLTSENPFIILMDGKNSKSIIKKPTIKDLSKEDNEKYCIDGFSELVE